ncbi:MAG: GH92 family glycosyl hydrolase [Tenuifilaceae bacterium]
MTNSILNRSKLRLAMIFLVFLYSQINVSAQQLTQFVDPLIGSGGHGHVFVGASVPFGAVQIGPNNIYKGWDWCSGYHYSDSLIIGFSQLHLSGTGIGDLGDVLIMPITGKLRLDKGRQEFPHNGYLSTFSHKNEIAKPGYYSVKMDNGVAVELTATERVGFHQYRFPKGKDAHVMIDLKEGVNDKSTDTYLEQIDEFTLKGYRFSSGWAKEQQVFFAICSSKPIKNLTIYNNDKPLSSKKGKGESVKGVIGFEQGDFVQLKVGISPVSADNALANITAEIPDWNFDEIVKQADAKWNKELSRIEIETKNEADKRIFYTSLYHTLIHPSLFSDYNGDYQGTDNKTYTKPKFKNYSVFSTWDTYRAAHPLFTLVAPERIDDFINSMLAIHDEQGFMPIWHLNGYETECMTGISSLQVVAEAYLKGFRGFDAERAYQAIRKTAMSDLRGLNYLREFKAIPSDVSILKAVPSDAKSIRTVAQAMELSISDGSIALMAKALGKNDDYIYFSKRAKNYQLFYDESVGFFRGIKSDGTRNPMFDPFKSTKPWANDYAEGNAWQYLWLAPQDVKGLINFLGGKDVFNTRLDSFFALSAPENSEILVDLTGNIGQYAHGNEPSHHIAYLYTYSEQQWKTAEKVRYIMKEFYRDDPDGLIGNEDCGQMSAWYIFSSLGFYPVFPASGDYVLGSPLFDKASIHLPGGKKFTVETVNNSSENIYIQQVELNGQKLAETFINHKDIVNGGHLKIVMGDKPNKSLGLSKEE